MSLATEICDRWRPVKLGGGAGRPKVPRRLLRDTAEFLFSELQRVSALYGVPVGEIVYGRRKRGRARGDILLTMARGEFFLRAFRSGVPCPLVAVTLQMSVRNVRAVKAQFKRRLLLG